MCVEGGGAVRIVHFHPFTNKEMSFFVSPPPTLPLTHHMLVDRLPWVLGDGDSQVGKEQLSALKELCLVEGGEMSKQSWSFSVAGVQWRSLPQKGRLDSASVGQKGSEGGAIAIGLGGWIGIHGEGRGGGGEHSRLKPGREAAAGNTRASAGDQEHFSG